MESRVEISNDSVLTPIRNFHVVGGGCFGSQYVRWLQIARDRKKIQFEKIIVIDRNPQCKLQALPGLINSVELIQQDWVDYLTQYLLASSLHSPAMSDHWVPSPLSPHLMFLAFLRAGGQRLPSIKFKQKKMDGSLPIPVQIPLADGNLALSFAEWICPTNCTEPPRCPKLPGPKIWDMKKALQGEWRVEEPAASIHILQCLHLTHAVGTIACRDILREFWDFVEKLLTQKIHEVWIATLSTCHGLASRADILYPEENIF